ncbi:uncharacterized protein TRUGW13939_04538 [Talaromyces rugulosus]|uniref:Uncharacterized protein n=1 Tax=Talaromyces rugulosus TaxID=121627 RepID=A0A7H8QUE9_TALRU|nr:uncharacterized protein TRUGW13939_04538 [Talaromyces rugulosus]QKX57426.1 hypothetical protein TRUGW13939_04538 [Talaromyces rugulosus]
MTEPKEPIVSHGRGGQGNIGADSTQYVDAEIVRAGPTGDQGDGAYSAGRGGAGNIGSPNVRPSTPGQVHDTEVVPDLAVRSSLEGDYHVGRGGQGNVHLDESQQAAAAHKKTPSSSVPQGLADKLKNKIFGKKE